MFSINSVDFCTCRSVKYSIYESEDDIFGVFEFWFIKLLILQPSELKYYKLIFSIATIKKSMVKLNSSKQDKINLSIYIYIYIDA